MAARLCRQGDSYVLRLHCRSNTRWPASVPARSPIRRTRTDRNKYIIWMIDVASSLINL